MQPQLTIDELVALTGISKRTIRYYVQIDLLDKPEGETRAARYGQKQLEQLLLIKKWSEAGMALDAIKRLLKDDPALNKESETSIGQSLVKTHVCLGRGIELVIDSATLKITHTELRQLINEIIQVVESFPEKK